MMNEASVDTRPLLPGTCVAWFTHMMSSTEAAVIISGKRNTLQIPVSFFRASLPMFSAFQAVLSGSASFLFLLFRMAPRIARINMQMRIMTRAL